MQVGKQVLRGVLGSDSTRYEIPLYQRTFDWDDVQFEKLWTDIRDLAIARQSEPGTEHFLGTLVLHSGHNIPNDFTFLVVDGQQRLTTLTMLLAATRDVYREFRNETTDADELADGVLIHRYKKSHPERFRLWPTQGDRSDFIAIMEENPNFSSDSNLVAAYKYFRTKLSRTVSLNADVAIDDIRSATLDGLRFVVITAEAQDNVYSIFESLNNTGLKLTQGDLLRNFFFSRLGGHAEQVHSAFWFPMQERLSRDDLAHLFWLELTWSDTEAKKDDTFRKQVKRVEMLSPEELRDEVKRFNQLSVLLEVMRLPSKESDPQVRRGLQRLVDFGIESIDPLVLALLSLRQSGRTTNGQTAEALAVIESFLVRRLLVRAPHNALSRILMRASKSLDANDPAEALRDYFSRDNKDFASDQVVRKAVVSVNFYRSGSARQRKTLLSWLEEELVGNEPAGLMKASIEHILPQNLTPEWRQELAKDLGDFASPEAVHETYVHTLANLTLSGYNSKLSDHAFERKRQLLIERSNIELNKWIVAKDEWCRNEILDRGKYLSDLIARTWIPPINLGNESDSKLDVAQLTDVIAQIPAGKWVSFGDLAEVVQSTVADVKRLVATTPIQFAWRVMDANGRHEQSARPDGLPAEEYVRRLEDEGVQFKASGEAMKAFRWSFITNRGDALTPTLNATGGPVAGPIREFLDEATNRLAPSVSDALRAFLTSWIADSGRVLLSVDPEDSDVLTATLLNEGASGDPIFEIRLTPTNGLWLRSREQPSYALVDPTTLDSLALR
jgi:alkylated DNA nucleotide flippase Atl1